MRDGLCGKLYGGPSQLLLARPAVYTPIAISENRDFYLSHLQLSQADVRRLIMSSAIKPSTLDPVPTFLLREFIDVLLPYVTYMVNSSLRQGRLSG